MIGGGLRTAFETTAPQKGELLSVVRQNGSNNLIVYFNSYGVENRPGKQPGRPFGTKFQNYRKVIRYDAHAIWFVEEKGSWYLEHQDRILDILMRYIVEHDIAAIKMIGSSAGGYAAIRMGLLLDQRLKHSGSDATVLSFAINPQTGFRPDLFARIERTTLESRWQGARLGQDPIVLAKDYIDAYAHMQIDLVELARNYQPRNVGIVLMYDNLNPIETTFCGDLADIDFILHFPVPLGLNHFDGATKILLNELWPVFDQALPFPKLDNADGELRALA